MPDKDKLPSTPNDPPASSSLSDSAAAEPRAEQPVCDTNVSPGQGIADTAAHPNVGIAGPSGNPETVSINVPNMERVWLKDYELLREIGRGGMGVVYKARQVSLSRSVAVKIILGGQLASEADVKRFQMEAKAAASLRHPNIVGVYEIGEHDGRCFYSMEYVEGKTLEDMIRDTTFRPKDAVAVAMTLAEAIQHAHDKNVLHRDLKPANVLISSSGQPKVADFGLAKALNEESRLTVTGQALGTPGYMPPEQAEGRLQEISPASDVYALGGILYAMLTGRPPFKGSSVADTIRMVSEKNPDSPRQFNSDVPRDLEAIILKCLAKSPSERYQTADEFRADLKNWEEGKPTKARRATLPRRAASFFRRHAKRIGFWAVVLALPVVLTAWYLSNREDPYARLRRQEVQLLVKRQLASPPDIIDRPHETRTEVDTLEQPNTSAFDLIARSQIWDFRAWRPVPADKMSELVSPVVMTSRVQYKKIKPANVSRVQARTSGVDVFLRCDSRPDSFRVFSERSPSLVGGQSMKTRQMEIDISDIAVGREFDVESTATYWNGFQRDDQRWMGTVVRSRPFKISFLVLLPEDRPFKSYRFRVAELDGYGIRPYEGEQLVIEDPDGKYLFWEIVTPTPQHVYRIDWEW